MTDRRSSLSGIAAALCIIVLISVMLCLTVLASRSYNYSSNAQLENSNRRAVLSYIVNSIRDDKGSRVRLEKRSGTDCLLLSGRNGYERLFYVKGGVLLEEYGETGFDPHPSDALAIGTTGDMHFAIDDEKGLLVIESDLGSSCVSIKD